MTTDLREALDDLAGDEVRGLRLDVAAARAVAARTSSGRLRLSRFTTRTTVWAAAAAAVLVALPTVLIFALFRPVTVPSEPQPGPGRWVWRSAAEVPPLRAGMMDAASMVLGMPVQRGATLTDVGSFPPHSLGRAPVLASADGRTYAALPWPTGSELLTLSKDGRRVAWVSMSERDRRATTTLYWLQLDAAVLHSAVLPSEASDEWPTQVSFTGREGDGVLVGTRYRNNVQRPQQEHVWRWTPEAGADVHAVCTCRATAFGVSPDGTLWQGSTARFAPVPGVKRSPVRVGTPTTSTTGWGGDVTSETLLIDDAGRVSRLSLGRKIALVTTSGGSETSVEVKGLGAELQAVWALARDRKGVYAWVLHGDQLRLAERDAELVLIDPATGLTRRVAHGDGRVVPLAVSEA
ncbi:hypothetical protein ACIB24_22775 [Spongisporangium articulatum]|uniref:Uncharacterized protein n=1 Tax=Spongisporangium articulatum TaxID=3362603 RepID=A0ABW8AU37_9ACTN